MNRFSVVEGKAVTVEDIDEARKLDMLVYGEEYYVTLRQCLEWNRKNSRIYTMIRDNEKNCIVAYVNISPVTDEYYEKIRSGSFIDTYLPPEAIVDYVLPDTYNVYFSSVVVHPAYQNSQVFLVLFNAIAEKFIQLAKDEILIKRMVADAVSDKGEKFCEMFGMKKLKDSNHASEIYEVYLLPPEFRVASRATRELYNTYKVISDELGFTHTAEPENEEPSRKKAQEKGFQTGDTVFISYATNDKATAAEICNFLEENGVSCWMAPRDVIPGENYPSQIVAAIRKCASLVLVASTSTNASAHVSNEVNIAFDNKKTIIPFKIEDFKFSDEYLYFLGRKNWIEAHSDLQAGLETLLHTLNPKIKKPVPPKPAPKPVEPVGGSGEEQGLSKEQIVQSILKKADQASVRQLTRYKNSKNFDELRSCANRFLEQVLTVYHSNKRITVHQPIDYLVDELLSSGSSDVIKVSGAPGSGKTILMQASFYELLRRYADGESRCLPVYVAISRYERADYSGGISPEKVRALLERDLHDYLTYIKQHEDVIPILFVDEVRELHVGKFNIENILQEVIKDYNISKRVVAVDTGLIKDKSMVKLVIPLVSERIHVRFETAPINVYDEEAATAFIAQTARYFDYDIDENKIYEIIKQLKYQEIDAFTVKLIAEEYLYGQHEINNKGDLYERLALSRLFGDGEKLRAAAESAFGYLFKQVNSSSLSVSEPHWQLIYIHQSFLNMLVAYYLVKKLEYGDINDASLSMIFDRMLTRASYTFLRAFLRDNFPLQEKLLRFIEKQFKNFTISQKSSAVSWLTSLTNRGLISEAAALLKPVYEEYRGAVKNRDSMTQQNYETQFFFRSVCYTLIKYGYANMLDDYLCLLIINDSANAINRGANVEYYDEAYEMHANDSYYLDTDINKGDNTIKALMWKVNRLLNAQGNGYIEKDLITLCMLLQRRIQSNEARKIKDLYQWVSEASAAIKKYQMRPQHISSKKIEYYFASIREDFADFMKNQEGFDISQKLYNTFRSLRTVKRRQWESRGIADAESISEHLYSAWIMAMLFLPETSGYEGYSKREILDMLLIHDMAEAKPDGQDLAPNGSVKDLDRKNEIMRKLLVKGTYPNVASLTYYYNVWTGYYQGMNINSKIARDLNLIQSVYTFCEYYVKFPEKFSEEDKLSWMGEKNKLETETGYKVYEKLVENNIDFVNIFKRN